MEVNSALMVQDLKDAEINLVVVDLFKYSMVSICFHVLSWEILTIYYLRQNIINRMVIIIYFNLGMWIETSLAGVKLS